MSTILVWKKQLQNFYAKFSVYVMIGLKLTAGLFVFGMINNGIGFSEQLTSIVCTIGLSVICAFLPMIVMVMAASVLVLVHLLELSLAVTAVTAIYFLLMYIFYFRFAPGTSWLVLIMAVAIGLKIPFVAAVAIGLLGTPVYIIPAVFGTIVYYTLRLLGTSSSVFKAEGMEEMIESAVAFMKQSMANREMWVMLAAVVLCILIVYGIRKCSVDYAWKIASGAGTVVAVLICTLGNLVLDVHISVVMIAVSSVLAIITGLVLELLFLSVDYTRTEFLEFEDDEYHYYVKAVPKFAVTVPEKNVQHITGNQENNKYKNDDEDFTPEDGRMKSFWKKEGSSQTEYQGEKKAGSGKSVADTDMILLTKSLNKELGLDVDDDVD